jgi:4-diphosphocytidyl-2-C-methyl-D-erythritol kinase
MAKINLFDKLIIESGTKKGIELICEGDEWAPQGEENLVYTACKRLLEFAGRKEDIKVTLYKKIPAGGGLASASTDAAAALIGVNTLLKLGVSDIELHNLASGLGSDVAFFLGGPLAFCSGKGEKIQEINRNFDFKAMLLLSNISCSTARVYANYEHESERFRYLKSKIDVLLDKNRIDLVTKMCANMLQISCFSLYRELEEFKTQVENLGIKPLCLSGSGSAMYHIVETTEEGRVDDFVHLIERNINCRCVTITNNLW